MSKRTPQIVIAPAPKLIEQEKTHTQILYEKAKKIDEHGNKKKTPSKVLVDPNEDKEKAPQKINAKIAHRIAALRAEKGWKQKELALKVNITTNLLTQYENGTAIPFGPILTRLENVLGVNLRKSA